MFELYDLGKVAKIVWALRPTIPPLRLLLYTSAISCQVFVRHLAFVIRWGLNKNAEYSKRFAILQAFPMSEIELLFEIKETDSELLLLCSNSNPNVYNVANQCVSHYLK